jgi:hypothetical protein
MSRLGVDTDIAELAIGHKRKGLERLYNLAQAWQLRCGRQASRQRAPVNADAVDYDLIPPNETTAYGVVRRTVLLCTAASARSGNNAH